VRENNIASKISNKKNTNKKTSNTGKKGGPPQNAKSRPKKAGKKAAQKALINIDPAPAYGDIAERYNEANVHLNSLRANRRNRTGNVAALAQHRTIQGYWSYENTAAQNAMVTSACVQAPWAYEGVRVGDDDLHRTAVAMSKKEITLAWKANVDGSSMCGFTLLPFLTAAYQELTVNNTVLAAPSFGSVQPVDNASVLSGAARTIRCVAAGFVVLVNGSSYESRSMAFYDGHTIGATAAQSLTGVLGFDAVKRNAQYMLSTVEGTGANWNPIDPMGLMEYKAGSTTGARANGRTFANPAESNFEGDTAPTFVFYNTGLVGLETVRIKMWHHWEYHPLSSTSGIETEAVVGGADASAAAAEAFISTPTFADVKQQTKSVLKTLGNLRQTFSHARSVHRMFTDRELIVHRALCCAGLCSVSPFLRQDIEPVFNRMLVAAGLDAPDADPVEKVLFAIRAGVLFREQDRKAQKAAAQRLLVEEKKDEEEAALMARALEHELRADQQEGSTAIHVGCVPQRPPSSEAVGAQWVLADRH
jgi:hypothetical protein